MSAHHKETNKVDLRHHRLSSSRPLRRGHDPCVHAIRLDPRKRYRVPYYCEQPLLEAVVNMPITPKPLADIAADSGFSMSDVAFLAGLDESTVCRLWEEPDWLDKIKGRSLQALISVLPGIAEYLFAYPLANRRSVLADELSHAGLEINRSSYRHLVREDGVPEQYLGNALSAALQIVRSDTRKAAAYLVRFWGREQDYALSFLFTSPTNKGLLVDVEPLIGASRDLIAELGKYKTSFHAIVAHATLMHHVAKTKGEFLTELTSSAIERHTALTYRSAMMGLILQSNDRKVASAYGQTVTTNPLLSMVEGWAFPTYTHDAKPTPDFSLPPSLLLRHTANEILWEIDHYNDAYLYYLLETGIPKVIQRDETFGLRVHDLVTRLNRRLETCTDPVTVTACERFLTKLRVDPADNKGDLLDRPW